MIVNNISSATAIEDAQSPPQFKKTNNSVGNTSSANNDKVINEAIASLVSMTAFSLVTSVMTEDAGKLEKTLNHKSVLSKENKALEKEKDNERQRRIS